MSLSLIAVFIADPADAGGILGRLFQEFAETLSITILISLLVSLTTTPMLCALLLRREEPEPAAARFCSGWKTGSMRPAFLRKHAALGAGRMRGWSVSACSAHHRLQRGRCSWSCRKVFSREQDNGLVIGTIQADQGISFELMKQKVMQLQRIVQNDPARGFGGGLYTGGRATNNGFLFITLKPWSSAHAIATGVVGRLRRPLGHDCRGATSSWSRRRICASAGGRATRNTSTRCKATIPPRSISGCRKSSPR